MTTSSHAINPGIAASLCMAQAIGMRVANRRRCPNPVFKRFCLTTARTIEPEWLQRLRNALNGEDKVHWFFARKAERRNGHLSSPVQISSRQARCQTMTLAAVMAITKWSILPGHLNLFIAHLRLV